VRWPSCVATVAVAVAAVGCSTCNKSSAIAELTSAEGPVERQAAGESAWGGVSVGAKYFLGDAARTGDGGAQLGLTGGAQIAMQKHTVLRFGGTAGQSRISVELGAIDLSGTGDYTLDVGDVKLSSGKIRITARGDGKSELKLTLGQAQVSTVGGKTIDLVLDVGIELGDAVVTPIDAGVDAAPVVIDAPIDAPPVATGATVTVTGKKGEILLEGEKKYKPLPEGESELPPNAKIRIGVRTTAKLVAEGTTLELAAGSHAGFAAGSLSMDLGHGKLSTANPEATLDLPGGAIAIKNTPTVPADVKLDTGGGGMKVTIGRGGGRLTGTGGSQLDMNRGESAVLLKNGQIRPLEAIPSYFDFRITAGEGSFTVHDPRPPTAIQFQFGGKCPDGGIIELDRDARYRTAKVSAGKDFANHLVKPGSWHYRLRCTKGGTEGAAVASGRVSVTADSGTRRLPTRQGISPFSPNGMLWTIGYQSVIPDIAVTFPGGGSSYKLHLARAGKDLTFDSSSTRLKIPGKSLTEGVYTYWFDRDGKKQDKVNSLKIEFDQTAPQVYIELPVNGRPWPPGDLDVKGAVLPDWTAAVEGAPIPIDRARRFIAKVGPPSGRALAIRLSHPRRGVHYYLRRGK